MSREDASTSSSAYKSGSGEDLSGMLDAYRHHVFISYREESDSRLARQIQEMLQGEVVEPGIQVSCILGGSGTSLNEHKDQAQEEYMQRSCLFLPIVSEAGLQRLTQQFYDGTPDPLLHTYEKALARQKEGKMDILPLLVGTMEDDGGYEHWQPGRLILSNWWGGWKAATPKTIIDQLLKGHGQLIDQRELEYYIPSILQWVTSRTWPNYRKKWFNPDIVKRNDQHKRRIDKVNSVSYNKWGDNDVAALADPDTARSVESHAMKALSYGINHLYSTPGLNPVLREPTVGECTVSVDSFADDDEFLNDEHCSAWARERASKLGFRSHTGPLNSVSDSKDTGSDFGKFKYRRYTLRHFTLMLKRPQPSPTFLADAKNLPPDQVVRVYGTHYRYHVGMGGEVIQENSAGDERWRWENNGGTFGADEDAWHDSLWTDSRLVSQAVRPLWELLPLGPARDRLRRYVQKEIGGLPTPSIVFHTLIPPMEDLNRCVRFRTRNTWEPVTQVRVTIQNDRGRFGEILDIELLPSFDTSPPNSDKTASALRRMREDEEYNDENLSRVVCDPFPIYAGDYLSQVEAHFEKERGRVRLMGIRLITRNARGNPARVIGTAVQDPVRIDFRGIHAGWGIVALDLYHSSIDTKRKSISGMKVGLMDLYGDDQRYGRGAQLPFDFEAYVSKQVSTPSYIRRSWLLSGVHKALMAPKKSSGQRVVLLKGDPGCGKSSLLAGFLAESWEGKSPAKITVGAFHTCSAALSDSLSPGKMVFNVARMLRDALPWGAWKESAWVCDLAKCESDPERAFEESVIKPLQTADAMFRAQGQTLVIVIDALDEALWAADDDLEEDEEEEDGEGFHEPPHPPSTIVSLLLTKARYLPEWCRILATTRTGEETEVDDKLEDFGLLCGEPIHISGAFATLDVSAYVQVRTKGHKDRNGRLIPEDDKRLARVREELVQKSNGNFQYARVALDILEVGTGNTVLDIRKDVSLLPGTLEGLYTELFNSMGSERFERGRWLLEGSLAAMEPLSREIIEWVCPRGVSAAPVLKDWAFCYSERWPQFEEFAPMKATSSPRGTSLRSRSLNSFIRRWEKEKKSEQAFEFYHLSLPEWLNLPPISGSQFKVDPEPGHHALAQVGIKKMETHNGYFMRHIAKHINEGLCGGSTVFVPRAGYNVGDSIGVGRGGITDLLTELRESIRDSERLEGLARFLVVFFPHLYDQINPLEIACLVQTLSELKHTNTLSPSCAEAVSNVLVAASDYSYKYLPREYLPARLLQYLAGMLGNTSPDAQQFGARSLGELAHGPPDMLRDIAATPGALAGLIYLLNSEEVKVRSNAVEALIKLSEDRETQTIMTAPKYLKILEELVKSPTPEKSLASAQVLEALMAGSKSDVKEYQKRKTAAIKKIASQAAKGHQPSATLIATDPDPVVFYVALDALIPQSTTSLSALEVLTERITSFPAAILDIITSRDKLARLAAMMKPSWEGRPKAVDILQQLTSSSKFDPSRASTSSPDLVTNLIALLPSIYHGWTDGIEEDWDTSWDGGVEPLDAQKERMVFDDVQKVVRGLAACILEKLAMKNIEIQQMIIHSQTALLGLVALVGAGAGPKDEGVEGTESAGRLLLLLAQSDVESRTSIAATPDVLSTLITIQSSPKFDELNKQAAARVLRVVASGRMESRIQRGGKRKDHGGLPYLVTLMRSESPGVRAQSAEAFAYLAATGATTQTTLGNEGVLSVLVRLLEPVSDDINDQAKGHRVEMSGDDAIWGRESGDSASVQESASLALASLSTTAKVNQKAIVDAAAVPRLISLLQDTSPPRVRVAAAQAIESLVRRNVRVQSAVIRAGALPPLIASLDAESPVVRARAAAALGAIARGSSYHQRVVAESPSAVSSLLAMMNATKYDTPESASSEGSPVLLSHNPGHTSAPDPPQGLPHEVARQEAQTQAVTAIISIMHRNLYTQDIVADAGGVSALSYLLQSEDASELTKELAVDALTYLMGGVTWINSKAYTNMSDTELSIVLEKAHSSAVENNNQFMSEATNNILQRINRRSSLWVPQTTALHECLRPFLHRGLIMLSSCYD